MKEVELNPIWDTPEVYDAIESEIANFFKTEFYLPLLKSIGKSSRVLLNSRESLRDAISKGRVVYSDGKFTGRFTADTSREIKTLGGKWRSGAWYLDSRKLPFELRDTIKASLTRFQDTLQAMDRHLQETDAAELLKNIRLKDLFSKVLWKADRSFKKTVQNLVVGPQLSDRSRERIAEEYTNNMKLYIKGWTEEEIIKLREKVQKRAFKGQRYEDLIDIIQRSYEVSQNKAKFLARQETSLLMAKFKETRYTELGSEKYRWDCVKGTAKHPVRPFHKRLDGKVFYWNNPPIVNSKGDRKHPGQDYGCRCSARPILTLSDATTRERSEV